MVKFLQILKEIKAISNVSKAQPLIALYRKMKTLYPNNKYPYQNLSLNIDKSENPKGGILGSIKIGNVGVIVYRIEPTRKYFYLNNLTRKAAWFNTEFYVDSVDDFLEQYLDFLKKNGFNTSIHYKDKDFFYPKVNEIKAVPKRRELEIGKMYYINAHLVHTDRGNPYNSKDEWWPNWRYNGIGRNYYNPTEEEFYIFRKMNRGDGQLKKGTVWYVPLTDKGFWRPMRDEN